ncbi:MAG: pro-sigmaK processing inhibitor BofA family protein [Tissierellaceae bacterium]|jgi:inhibitor of the pro-sigma K processing machinery|nr:pro-sigmaK processing inhibitor BofA [Tissierellia bacterium]
MSNIMAYIIGLVILYIVGMILVIPIRILTKLLINGLIGGLVLFLFNLFGGLVGLSIVINPLNAIIVGILGVPGVVLLLILQALL